MTDAPWNGDERSVKRSALSADARKMAESVVGRLHEVPDPETNDAVTTALHKMRRFIVASLEELASRGRYLLILIFAPFFARARRATSRAINAAELSSAALVGSFTYAAPIMLAIAFNGSLLGSPGHVALANSRQSMATSMHADRSLANNARGAIAGMPSNGTDGVHRWSARIASPSKQLPAAADGHIGRDPRKIEFGHEIEVGANGQEFQTSKVTVECDESSIIATTTCNAYDEVFPRDR